MRSPCILCSLLLMAFLLACVSSSQEAPQTNATVRITVIRYCLEPFRTFEIAGTDLKGVTKLSDLTKALRKHKEKNPGVRYEILAEVKSTPEGEKDIVKAVTKAGVSLEHYWAATSSLKPGEATGPHAIGYVDHIDRCRSLR